MWRGRPLVKVTFCTVLKLQPSITIPRSAFSNTTLVTCAGKAHERPEEREAGRRGACERARCCAGEA